MGRETENNCYNVTDRQTLERVIQRPTGIAPIPNMYHSYQTSQEPLYTGKCQRVVVTGSGICTLCGHDTLIYILRHREINTIRLVLYEQKTMTMMANHIIDPRIELERTAFCDGFNWGAYDYTQGSLKETFFQIRFGTSVSASEFQKKFEGCQKLMKGIIVNQRRHN